MGRTLKKKKQPLPWWRRILLALVLMAMVLVTALVLTRYLAGRQLASEIAKISQAGEPVTFRDLRANFSQLVTGKDAAQLYAEALSYLNPDDLGELERINLFYRKSILSLPISQFPREVREKTTQNLSNLQPLIEKFDQAADLPLSHFDIGIEQGIQVCNTRLQRIKKAAMLLSLRTLDLVMRNEDDAAVDSVISLLKMMRIFDPQLVMVSYAAKVVFVSLACRDIHLLLQQKRGSEASLARLQKILSETIPTNVLEKMFLTERVYQLEIARNFIPAKVTARFLQDKAPPLPERRSLPRSRWAQLRLRLRSTRFFRDMAYLIDTGHRPWPEPLDILIGNPPHLPEESNKLIASGASFVNLTAEILAFTRCTVLAIAVERYRRSQGELPDSLDDICPDYIDSIPLDPFTGKQLLYSRDEKTYTVYSTGFNRRDDNASLLPKLHDKKPEDLGLIISLDRGE